MPAVLAIFNEAIMSRFSPPRLAGTPGSHKVSWKQSKYNQAHLEVERNVSQDHRCDFWEVKMLEARTEEYILDRDIHWQGTESRPRGHTSSLPSYYWEIVCATDNLNPRFSKKKKNVFILLPAWLEAKVWSELIKNELGSIFLEKNFWAFFALSAHQYTNTGVQPHQ